MNKTYLQVTSRLNNFGHNKILCTRTAEFLNFLKRYSALSRLSPMGLITGGNRPTSGTFLSLLRMFRARSSVDQYCLQNTVPGKSLETLRNRTAQGEDGKISLCDMRDCLLRKLFDAISGLSLPSS